MGLLLDFRPWILVVCGLVGAGVFCVQGCRVQRWGSLERGWGNERV